MWTEFDTEKSMPGAVTIADMARSTASSLVQREEVRARSRMVAYAAVATKVGTSPSWLRKLIGQGVNRVDAEIKRRLDALLIRELEAEIARLTHELALARQSGMDPHSQQFSEVETHLARARAALNGTAPASTWVEE